MQLGPGREGRTRKGNCSDSIGSTEAVARDRPAGSMTRALVEGQERALSGAPRILWTRGRQ